MKLKSRPELLIMEIDREQIVSHMIPTMNGGNKQLWKYQSDYPLPENLEKALVYKPEPGFLIISNETPVETAGWQRISSETWSDSHKNMRDSLIQSTIRQHLRNKGIKKIGRDWVFDTRDIEEDNGAISTIHHCASFGYAEINGTDVLFYDFIRKVRSSMSIGEEIQKNIFPHGEGGDNNFGDDVMVSVANSSGSFSSGELRKIRENENINQLMPNSTESYRNYLSENGVSYSDIDAESTFLIDVRHGRKTLQYASDRVFRVLRIEDWKGNLRQAMSDDLRLLPSQHVKHTDKGRRLLYGIKFAGEKLELNYNSSKEWNVQVADVSSMCKVKYSNGNRNLLHNGRWIHHIKHHSELHSEALPNLEITFCMDEDDVHIVADLKKRTESVLKVIPQLNYSFSQNTIILRGDNKTEIQRSISSQILKLNSESEHLIVSALRPDRPHLNCYTLLKKELTLAKHIHQNYSIRKNDLLKAPNTDSAHIMNACQLLFKIGRLPVPFRIAEGDIDLTVGIDIGRSGRNRSRPAMAVAIDRFGKIWGGNISSDPQPGEEMSENTIRDLFNSQITRYEIATGESAKRVMFLRDGLSTKAEMDAVDVVTAEYVQLGVDVLWITIQKSGIPRLLNYSDDKVSDILPAPQSYLKTSSRTSWCWTTGSSSGNFPGIPKGFGFIIEKNFEENPLTIDQISRILIAQSKSSQVNPYSNTRLPLTIHLADKMAKGLARGSIPPNYSGKGFPAC